MTNIKPKSKRAKQWYANLSDLPKDLRNEVVKEIDRQEQTETVKTWLGMFRCCKNCTNAPLCLKHWKPSIPNGYLIVWCVKFKRLIIGFYINAWLTYIFRDTDTFVPVYTLVRRFQQ